MAAVPGVTPVAQRVRWPQFAPYVNNGFDEYMSWYHGLILKLEKRLSQNMSFLVNYTWSKTLDESDSLGNGNIYGQPTSNPTRFNIDMFKGPAGFVSGSASAPPTLSRRPGGRITGWPIWRCHTGSFQGL